MAAASPRAPTSASPRQVLVPLALAQFIASYACTNMNVAVSAIAKDLNTTVSGVQVAITLFTLTMAALMIPGSKVSDIVGRGRAFRGGLIVYGVGALLAALAPSIGILIVGYSLLEGIGSALMIPPIYILVTVLSSDLATRARALGVISAAAGVGAALGPLVGGLITTLVGWRFSFVLQVLVILGIIGLTLRVHETRHERERPWFDTWGALLIAVGLVLVVLGILSTGTYGWLTAKTDFKIAGLVVIPAGGIAPVWPLVVAGLLFLAGYVWHATRVASHGRAPLVALKLLQNRTSNLGLLTQNVQWLILQGSFFVISVYLQTVQHRTSIETGLILTPATIGILLAGAMAGRMARNRTQRFLVRMGFLAAEVGLIGLLAVASFTSSFWAWLAPLLVMGLGVGVMLTASANVVQSAFGDEEQGEISGVSRSASNLGSSLGTAIVGSVLLSGALTRTYGAALLVMCVIGLIGLGAALLLPPPTPQRQPQGAARRAVA